MTTATSVDADKSAPSGALWLTSTLFAFVLLKGDYCSFHISLSKTFWR